VTPAEASEAPIESLPLLVNDLLQVFGDADKASSWVCWDRRGTLCHSPFERMSMTLSAEVLAELAALEKRVRG
jgi:hypothetical protein